MQTGKFFDSKAIPSKSKSITSDHASALTKTLYIAESLEQINSIINPYKVHTQKNSTISALKKEINAFKDIRRVVSRTNKQELHESIRSSPTEASASCMARYKKSLSLSIRNMNQRVKLSKAGQGLVGKLLINESLPFNKSIEKTFGSNSPSPVPSSLPFVSVVTGKTKKSMKLPEFHDYLEKKGSNYLKKRYKDEILGRFDKAALEIKKFAAEFDTKAAEYIKACEGPPKVITKAPGTSKSPKFLRFKRRATSKVLISCQTPFRDGNVRGVSSSNLRFEDSVRGFNVTKQRENQRFQDILAKLELERPLMLREKAKLIQDDSDQYKSPWHSLKKFETFKELIEKHRQENHMHNFKQGSEYMAAIEGFRLRKYKPSQGELEILQFWKRMVEFGWAISAKDVQEAAQILRGKCIFNKNCESLLECLSRCVKS